MIEVIAEELDRRSRVQEVQEGRAASRRRFGRYRDGKDKLDFSQTREHKAAFRERCHRLQVSTVKRVLDAERLDRLGVQLKQRDEVG